MAHTSLKKPVSSLNTLTSSISFDRQVYLWFSRLIRQPEVRAKLSASPEIAELYGKLTVTIRLQRILYVMFPLLLMLTGLSLDILVLIRLTLSLVPFIVLHLSKKNIVIKISREFLLQEIGEEDIPNKTLYHIAELSGRKYSLPTLVDFITSMDTHCRRAIRFSFIFACFLYPFNNLALILATPIAAYFTVSFLAGTSLYFKYLVR